jgi:hypothetical protein
VYRFPTSFPEEARSNAEQQAVEFGVETGEYHGVVRAPRGVFQRLLPERPTPERCVEAYYLQKTRFESIAERKLRRRQLTERECGDQRAGLGVLLALVCFRPYAVLYGGRSQTNSGGGI